jgi:hypothetical protein
VDFIDNLSQGELVVVSMFALRCIKHLRAYLLNAKGS